MYMETGNIGSNSLYISVIVATYRREKILCDTLQLLTHQSYPSFELIVVDQTHEHLPETDKCLRTLSRSGLIRYYRLETASLPNARNFGVSKAQGEIILFVDDDVIPDSELIYSHVKEYANQDVGGVAGRRTLLEKGEPLQPIGIVLSNSDSITNFSSIIRQESVQWASGCNMSFRKKIIAETGGFEKNFLGSAAYEEIDFCFRLRRRGYRIVFSPDAHLLHLVEKSGGCENRTLDKRYYHGFIHNSLLFAFRNLPKKHWLKVIWHRFLMSLALTRQRRDPRFAFMFGLLLARSIMSYFASLDSLRGNLS